MYWKKTAVQLVVSFMVCVILLSGVNTRALAASNDTVTLKESPYSIGEGWTVNATFTGNNPYSIAKGENEYLLVGAYGSIMKSKDGRSWKSLSTFGDYQFTAIASNGTKYVLFGTNTEFENEIQGKPSETFVSSDGLTWKSANFYPEETIYDVAWGNNQFIAVGSKHIYTSKDGESWTKALTFEIHYAFPSIEYVNGKFFVYPLDSDKLYISADGQTWTSKPRDQKANIQQLIWVNNKYIGVGNGIYTSADGVSWTKQSNSPKNAVLNSIYTDGKMYIATGRDSDDYQKQVIYTSSNGTSWTKRDVSSLDVHILTLYPVEGGFAGIGSRQQDNFSDTIFSLYTKNGYEYNKQLIATTITGELSGIATNGKRTVAVGLLGTILYTDNGSAWHAAKSLSFGKFARPHLFDIAYGANKFVAVANGGVYTSTDGANWSFVKVAELDEYGGLRKILWTGKFFVASDQSEGVFTSSDGIKWTKVKSVSNDWLTSMVWDGKRLVAAMQVYNNGNQYTKIVQTSNGTSWTTLATLDAIVIELGWNGERYFAVNPYDNREAWVSSDAKSWSKQPMNISSDSNVAFIKAFNGYFMTYNTNLNENYELKTSYAVSKDGKQWKEIFIPHTAVGFNGTEHHSIMSDAVQAHGKYIFAGAGGLIMSNSELQVEVPVHIKVNGKELALSAENGKPYIDNGTTYIPLKVIGDALQYTVTWHASSKSVEFDNGSQSLSFNSVAIKEGRSYVPLRKISEQLGYKVGYSNNQQEIVITIDE